MVKICNISITPPRRCPKGRLCNYIIIHMLLHLILLLGWYQIVMTRAYRKLAISPTSNFIEVSRQLRSSDLRFLLVSPIKSQTSCFKHDLIA